MIKAVLFDLDGTFADTAPDLAYALNQVLQQEKHPPLPYERIRPVVSHGGIALIKLGFSELPPESPEFARLRQDLLDVYKNNISRHTTLFIGMDLLIERLEEKSMLWGIVTNKPSWLTDPLMSNLGLTHRAAVIVSGDTTAERKPHPLPLIHACEQMRCKPGECLYVGDAERDIIAGNRAGMKTITALFGYIEENDNPENWGADAMIAEPLDIEKYL
jgi:phosphoglycolate phosphatase